MSENIEFCQICFFPWPLCTFFLSNIGKMHMDSIKHFALKPQIRFGRKNFWISFVRNLCNPDLVRISAAILLFRKAQGKCHFERGSPYVWSILDRILKSIGKCHYHKHKHQPAKYQQKWDTKSKCFFVAAMNLTWAGSYFDNFSKN